MGNCVWPLSKGASFALNVRRIADYTIKSKYNYKKTRFSVYYISSYLFKNNVEKSFCFDGSFCKENVIFSTMAGKGDYSLRKNSSFFSNRMWEAAIRFQLNKDPSSRPARK